MLPICSPSMKVIRKSPGSSTPKDRRIFITNMTKQLQSRIGYSRRAWNAFGTVVAASVFVRRRYFLCLTKSCLSVALCFFNDLIERLHESILNTVLYRCIIGVCNPEIQVIINFQTIVSVNNRRWNRNSNKEEEVGYGKEEGVECFLIPTSK